MRSYLIVFVVATVTVFSTQAGAQQRGPSTPEERARAIQTAKSLQSDPLARNVQEDREWLVKWLIEVPDGNYNLVGSTASAGVLCAAASSGGAIGEWSGLVF